MSIAVNASTQEFPCPHYSLTKLSCGGCAYLHLPADEVHSQKLSWLLKSLEQKNVIAQTIRPLFFVPPNARRRITLTARRVSGKLQLGYHAANSHDILDIETCLVAKNELIEQLPAIRKILEQILQQNESLETHLLLCNNGIDAVFNGACLKNTIRATQIFEALKALNFVRLSVGDVLQECRIAPFLTFGSIKITPPPSSFVQACAESEIFMQACVLEAVGKKSKKIADLFCGIGTFTGALLATKHVHGFENDTLAVAALTKGLNASSGIKPYHVIVRDLFRRPLVKHELNEFDAVVINPPRAGAEAQAKWLAQSNVKNIAYVSCNPHSFARDAAILCDAGFGLEWVQPIDQFEWSEHLEIIGCFIKK